MAPPLLSSIPQPPFGSTPLARPSGNPGEAADGSSMVQEAVDLLEKALPKLPVGHPIHKAVTSAISSLSKHAPPQSASPGIGMQGLKQLLAQKMRGSPLAALMGGGAAGAAGAAPGGPPQMPQAAPMPPGLMGGAGAGASPPPM